MSNDARERTGTTRSKPAETADQERYLPRIPRNERGQFAISVLTFGTLLGVWQAYVVLGDVPAVILPSPLEVGVVLLERYPVLLADAGVTALTALLGLTLGTVVGLGLGFGMVLSKSLSRTLLPYMVALRIAPLIAIAPLLFLWFGRGIPARALLVATITVFPMTISTLEGLQSTPTSYLDLMRSIDAARITVFLRVRVPAAAPSIFAGFKIAATLSIIGAVVAEFVTLNAGIGYRIFETASFLQTTESFAALVVLAILGNIFYFVPALLERRLWTTGD